MALKVGDKVWSKYHGEGVVNRRDEGGLFVDFEGRTHIYAPDGRYFTDGHFKDQEPALTVIESAPESE